MALTLAINAVGKKVLSNKQHKLSQIIFTSQSLTFVCLSSGGVQYCEVPEYNNVGLNHNAPTRPIQHLAWYKTVASSDGCVKIVSHSDQNYKLLLIISELVLLRETCGSAFQMNSQSNCVQQTFYRKLYNCKFKASQ